MGYTAEQKTSALDLLRVQSNSYATVRDITGIPPGTLAGWAKAAGIERSTVSTEAATKARIAKMAERRSRLREKLLRYAEGFADRADRASRHGKARDGKLLIDAAEVALKNFRLEMGEATQVTEERSQPSEKVASKLDDLAQRRSQKTA